MKVFHLILSAPVLYAFQVLNNGLKGAAFFEVKPKKPKTSRLFDVAEKNQLQFQTISSIDLSSSDSDSTHSSQSDDFVLPSSIQEINRFIVEFVKGVLFLYYGDRNYARFAALEIIARVPYFSYTSVLHLYETLGWFRKKEYIKMHFAESWNELHHLLIMEALGGTEKFGDRFVAQHIAFFYYWFVVLLYFTAPSVAYNLNMHVERHAFDTYDKFLKSHGDELKLLPPPAVAVEYYQDGDLSLFDSFQHSQIYTNDNSNVIQTVSSPTSTSHQSNHLSSSSSSSDVNRRRNHSTDVDRSFLEGSVYFKTVALINNDQADPSEMKTTPDCSITTSNLIRRPKINTLYDVFYNICIDEAEHALTMETLCRDIYYIKD